MEEIPRISFAWAGPTVGRTNDSRGPISWKAASVEVRYFGLNRTHPSTLPSELRTPSPTHAPTGLIHRVPCDDSVCIAPFIHPYIHTCHWHNSIPVPATDRSTSIIYVTKCT
eukprot:GHVU01068906.1.p2 GENE.GHVU01068906.1~~GHVU01068906.1.p2  ORF type:complete len:112 (+),score=2.12 GHVU01068906.1:1181-1516(+)